MIGWLTRAVPMLLIAMSLVVGPALPDQTHFTDGHSSYAQSVMEEASPTTPLSGQSPSDNSEKRPAEKACHIGVVDCHHLLGLLFSDNRSVAYAREHFLLMWDDELATRTIDHDCRPPIVLT